MILPRHIVTLAILSLLSATGCALFGTGGDPQRTNNESLKPTLADADSNVPVRRIVRLDTSIVSALSTDKRVRELAWEELDESGLMSPEDRRRLNQSGIRVGVSGGTLPWNLSSLLRGERVQQHEADTNSQCLSKSGHASSFGSHVAIPEGSSSLIELPNDDQMLNIPAGRIAGMYKGTDLESAHCVLQLTATEYGAGWVVVRFLPQIRHGAMTARYSVSDNTAQMPTRQRIQPLYEQQFELKLHAGETVVIGHQSQEDWTVGRLMFQEDTLSARNERLIVLKLQQIEEIKGQKSVTVNYHKY